MDKGLTYLQSEEQSQNKGEPRRDNKTKQQPKPKKQQHQRSDCKNQKIQHNKRHQQKEKAPSAKPPQTRTSTAEKKKGVFILEETILYSH